MEERIGVIALVMNAGSSSLKSAAFATGEGTGAIDPEPAWSAEVRWTTLPARTRLQWKTPAGNGAFDVTVDEHGSAAAAMIAEALRHLGAEPDIVGHRVVHGLNEIRCALIDERIRDIIERAAALAPQHNRAALAAIDAVAARYPHIVQAADFDTAFHTTLPNAAAAYALPYEWFAQRGMRRYGFHGISHRYCAERSGVVLARDPRELRIVSAHLGNGCSLAAIAAGRSIDTTMGFTPLDGVVMGSRSGSVDPGLLLHLIASKAYDVDRLEHILNEQSGLLGLSGISEDIRDVQSAAQGGNAQAQLAVDVYVHRLAGGIAAMAAALRGIDVLAFTGGVGEHNAELRALVCDRLQFLGVPSIANDAPSTGDREIGSSGSDVRVTVIVTREEYAIARDIAPLAGRPLKHSRAAV